MDAIKKIIWLGDSQETLRKFPEDVKDIIGYALHKSQKGLFPKNAKPLIGFKPAVIEIMTPHDKNTYRTVFTTKIKDVIYVLHCFQKKSTRGIRTPKHEIDLIRQRLKDAYLLSEIKR
jgi:phage-related protein